MSFQPDDVEPDETLTIEIKLLDVFQSLVDKVEASQSLQEEQIMRHAIETLQCLGSQTWQQQVLSPYSTLSSYIQMDFQWASVLQSA